MSAGLAAAANFLPELNERAFRSTSRYPDAPRTPSDLEATLRAAREKDPTQPWHLFLLGQVRWEQGARGEAEALWQEMLERPFEGVPYFEYSTLAFFLERFHQPALADRAYAEALRRRREFAQPIGWSTIIETFLNMRVCSRRNAPWLDEDRAFVWFQRCEELFGPGESDAVVATVWQKYFRERGDAAREQLAAAIVQKTTANPMDPTPTLVRYDYALTVLIALSLAFWAGSAGLLLRAPRAGASRLAMLSRRERRTLFAAGLLPLLLSPGVASLSSRFMRHASLPIPTGDALGSAFVVSTLDRRLRELDTPPLRFAAAVAHHLAGDVDRARELYVSLGEDNRARRNLEALDRGSLAPPEPLTAGDFADAWLAVSPRERLWWLTHSDAFMRETEWMFTVFAPITLANAMLLAGLLGAFWRIRRKEASAASPELGSDRSLRSRQRRLLTSLTPGVPDLKLGRPARGYLVLGGFMLALTALVGQLTPGDRPAPGPLTAALSANISAQLLPVPPSESPADIPVALRWAVFWAYPHARPFWSLVGLALLASLGLQITAWRDLRRASAQVIAPCGSSSGAPAGGVDAAEEQTLVRD